MGSGAACGVTQGLAAGLFREGGLCPLWTRFHQPCAGAGVSQCLSWPVLWALAESDALLHAPEVTVCAFVDL